MFGFEYHLIDCMEGIEHLVGSMEDPSKASKQVLAWKNVQKTTFEVAEMILGPWNQQILI